MATITLPNSTTFVVPANNSDIVIRCYGGKGQDGSASGEETSGAPGANGGYVEGTLNVSPGDVLHIHEISGGNGPSASWGDFSGRAYAGNGGDGISVRYGSDDESSTVIVAGGGGGGGGATADEWSDADTDAGSGGVGGGAAGDGEDADTSWTDTAHGGTGGDSSTRSGESGDTYTDGHAAVGAAAAGGGGGGGWNGGGGGGADARAQNSATYGEMEHAAGAGGGGGDGYTDTSVSNVSQSAGYNSDSAYVEIDYTPVPQAPDLTSISFNAEVPEINIQWDLWSDITDGYYIYRGQSPGFTADTNSRIHTANSYGTNSFTDQGVTRGNTYYYKVTAFNDDSGNESASSNERNTLLAARVDVYENGDWVSYPLKVWDDTNSVWIYPSSVKAWDEGDSTWYIESNR